MRRFYASLEPPHLVSCAAFSQTASLRHLSQQPCQNLNCLRQRLPCCCRRRLRESSMTKLSQENSLNVLRYIDFRSPEGRCAASLTEGCWLTKLRLYSATNRPTAP